MTADVSDGASVGTVEIPLTRGLAAIVDADDADLVLSHGKWHAHPGSQGGFYAVRRTSNGGRRGYLMMHGLLIGSPFADHKDGNGLNNRRSNLRPAGRVLNSRNRAMGSNNTSGFKGVSLVKASGLWRASIFLEGKVRGLGDFARREDAARAYDAAALDAWGEFSCVNFPAEGQRGAR